MKTAILSICFSLCFWCSVSAQFVLTDGGFKDVADTSKAYIVLPVNGKTQNDLYNETKKFITASYVSAKDVLSESYPEMLSISGYDDFALKTIGLAGRVSCDLHYKVNAHFKDNRLRIEFIIVDLRYQTTSIPLKYSHGTVGIFRKNGEVRDEVAKAQLEETANSFVNGLITALNGHSSDDTW